MSKVLIGRKLGMTRMFTETGKSIPLTAIACGPCPVLQTKTEAKDGYTGYQLGIEELARKVPVTKARLGHFKRWGSKQPLRHIEEVRCALEELPESGTLRTVELFAEGDVVDVIGTTRGKGFQGVMRRHGFRGQPASHGTMGHRVPGSVGASSDPSRVMKGMRMAGRMGAERRTVRNLRVCRVDADNHVLFVSGAVPGAPGSLVRVRAVKRGARGGAGS